MRLTQTSRLIALSVALGLALSAASFSFLAPAAQAASGPLDAQSTELVRLINGARAANGKGALNVDPFLAAKARDGAIPCPDDAAKSIAGRAQDFAAWGNMSHNLRLCNAAAYTLSGTTFVSVLQSWGYGGVGEIDLSNRGYGSGAFLYSYNGWQTWTYSTTGNGMLGWATSSSHWNIVMGGYDRVGCGGWAGGSTYYYDCAFGAGGPNGVKAPPTNSPFDLPLPTPVPPPDPTAAPTPVPTPVPTPYVAPPANGGGGSGGGSDPGSGGSGGAVGDPGSGGEPTSATDPVSSGNPPTPPTPSATAVVLGVMAANASATPGTGPASAARIGGGTTPGDGTSDPLAYIARIIALLAGLGAALLYGSSVVLSLRRRRREMAG